MANEGKQRVKRHSTRRHTARPTREREREVDDRPVVLSHEGSGSRVLRDFLSRRGHRLVLIRDRREVDAWFDRPEEEGGVIPAAILIMGGSDIYPGWYGERTTYTRGVDHDRDRAEWRLMERAHPLSIPTLGICRGHQFLAVAYGASLAQDLREDRVTPQRHDAGGPHPLDPRTVIPALARRLPDGAQQVVNSYHHQGVRAAPGGFTVAARGEDGVIEAIFSRQRRALGVQFHPEFHLMEPSGPERWGRLFDWWLAGFPREKEEERGYRNDNES